MKKLKVIGIGNRIMGDDGIGVYIVEELIKQQFLYDNEYIVWGKDEAYLDIVYVVGETDIDYCLDCLDLDDERIIIIDASISGKEPGTVTEFTINDMSLCTSMMVSTHNLNIIEAARRMMNHCNFTIIGIEPEIVDYRLRLSDTLNIEFVDIIEDVKKSIMNLIK